MREAKTCQNDHHALQAKLSEEHACANTGKVVDVCSLCKFCALQPKQDRLWYDAAKIRDDATIQLI